MPPPGDQPPAAPYDPPSFGAQPPSLEAIEQELHSLTTEHARLRGELEDRYREVRSIEDRFLSLRPDADASVQRELKRRMVLSRPWREELARAYQALLGTAQTIGAVTLRIHELQLRAAHLASMGGDPQFTSSSSSSHSDRR